MLAIFQKKDKKRPKKAKKKKEKNLKIWATMYKYIEKGQVIARDYRTQ